MKDSAGMQPVSKTKERSVPWECTVCGRRGTVEVPADVMGLRGVERHRGLKPLFEATMDQHGLKQRCGFINIRWDWPECWREEPQEEPQP